jgi:hypothetical protein
MQRGIEFGQWKFNSNKNEILLQSSFSKEAFNGIHKVIKLTEKEFYFSKNKIIFFFKKIDLVSVLRQNKNSNLEGTWKLNHNDFDDLFLILKLPNNFTLVSASSNSVSSESGEWEYLPKTKELNLVGTHSILKGKSKVKDVSDTFLGLVRPQETLFFDKVNSKNIAWLKFKQEELETLTNEESKLPKAWRSTVSFSTNLAKFKTLEYNFGSYVKEADALRYSKTIKDVTVNKLAQSISIANKLLTKYDTIQTSESYKGKMVNNRNPFFPEEEPNYYKVVGKEKMKDNLCTVVEGFLGEKKVKYWMIDNSPGVYAKIIKESTNEFFNETNYSIEILTGLVKVSKIK